MAVCAEFWWNSRDKETVLWDCAFVDIQCTKALTEDDGGFWILRVSSPEMYYSRLMIRPFGFIMLVVSRPIPTVAIRYYMVQFYLWWNRRVHPNKSGNSSGHLRTKVEYYHCTFSSYLALLVWKSNILIKPHLPTRKSGDPDATVAYLKQAGEGICETYS